MNHSSHNFNFYRSFLLQVLEEDHIEIATYRCFEEKEQPTKSAFRLHEINMHYLSMVGADALDIGQRVCVKLGIKSFFSKWDIYLYGKVVRSFGDIDGTNYGVNLEPNIELTYFIKEFINRFGAIRLRESLINSSLSEKSFNIHEGIEILSTLCDFYQDLISQKDQLNLQRSLSAVAKVAGAREANIWLINTAQDKLENIVSTRGEKYKEIDYREGYLGEAYCKQDIINRCFNHKSEQAFLTIPFRNHLNKVIGVVEFKSKYHGHRFDYADEKNIRLLGNLLGAYYSDYNPISGNSEIGDFNPALPVRKIYLGHTLKAQKINTFLHKISTSPFNVMLLGETGTGKSTIAKAMMKKSALHHAPFDLIDFSKSQGQEIYSIDWNEPGNIILENINLLDRVEQKVLFEKINFGKRRIFTLCSVELGPLVLENQFYQPLYRILSHNLITLSPLRQRQNELVALAQQILKLECERRADKIQRHFSAETLKDIQNHSWPGNLSELEKVIRKALFKSPESESIDLEISLNQAKSEDPLQAILELADKSLGPTTHLDILMELLGEIESTEQTSQPLKAVI